MLRRLALEPAFSVERSVGGRLEPIFASDSFEDCLRVFEAAPPGGELELRCGVRVLRSRRPAALLHPGPARERASPPAPRTSGTFAAGFASTIETERERTPMSPISLALAGLLAYRTCQGQGRLADMIGWTPPEGVASDAPSSTPGAAPGMMGTGNILDDLGRLFGGAGGGTFVSTISSGLADLMRRFQEAGHGAAAQSWIGTGPNQRLSPAELETALGSERLDWLQQRTVLSRAELLDGLSRELPEAVDKLTPDGRVPTECEAARLVRR
jgi:uncharacterized protein YidB (DUF937 family)